MLIFRFNFACFCELYFCPLIIIGNLWDRLCCICNIFIYFPTNVIFHKQWWYFEANKCISRQKNAQWVKWVYKNRVSCDSNDLFKLVGLGNQSYLFWTIWSHSISCINYSNAYNSNGFYVWSRSRLIILRNNRSIYWERWCWKS